MACPDKTMVGGVFKPPKRVPFPRSHKEAPLELALVQLCFEKRIAKVCPKKIDAVLKTAIEEIKALQKE